MNPYSEVMVPIHRPLLEFVLTVHQFGQSVEVKECVKSDFYQHTDSTN